MVFLQDNVIFDRLTETSQYKELTVAHLEQFATEGKNKREGDETILKFLFAWKRFFCSTRCLLSLLSQINCLYVTLCGAFILLLCKSTNSSRCFDSFVKLGCCFSFKTTYIMAVMALDVSTWRSSLIIVA